MCNCSCNNDSHDSIKLVSAARIVENLTIAPGTFALVLDVSDALARVIEPGQFVELNLRQPDLVLPRPVSVYRVHQDAEGGRGLLLELRYQVMGEGTSRLSMMGEGAELEIFGPLGKRWPVPEGVQRALLVGGGIGSAPLAMLAKELVEGGAEVTMVQAARSADLLIEAYHFEAECQKHIVATDDGSRGYAGLVTGPLQALLDEVGAAGFDIAYICGPEPMQEACANLTLAAGIETYVSLERMMACGVGACLTCVVPTTDGLKRVCADGPVFNAEEVDWDEARGSRVH